MTGMNEESGALKKTKYIKISQKMNGVGITGVSLIIMSLLLFILVYYGQLKEIETAARSLRYGITPDKIIDLTIFYIILGAANLIGIVLVIIGRDFYYPTEHI